MSPRNTRTARPFAAAVLAVSVGMVLLPACSEADTTSNGPSSSPGASSSLAPSAAIKAVGFDEAFRTHDGIVVQITEISERKLEPFPTTDDPDAKEGDPYVFIVTKTTNRTGAATQFYPDAALRYGPENTAAAQVSVDEIEGAVNLGPKESYDNAFGFIIPKQSYDQVVMELNLTIDPLRTAVFSGSIKPT